MNIKQEKQKSLDNLIEWIATTAVMIPVAIAINKEPMLTLKVGGVIGAIPASIYFGKYLYYNNLEEGYNQKNIGSG